MSQGRNSNNNNHNNNNRKEDERKDEDDRLDAFSIADKIKRSIFSVPILRNVNDNNNNNSNTKKSKDFDYLLPGLHSEYPHYNQIFSISDSQTDFIPILQTSPIPQFIYTNLLFDPKTVNEEGALEPHCPIYMITGPDDGLYECINDISSRRQFLQHLKQQLMNNIPITIVSNEITEPEAPNLEDVKKKLASLNKIEKELKKVQFIFYKAKNDKKQGKSETRIFGKTVDSYAYDYIKDMKIGYPNCDSYFAQTFDNNIIFAIADGVGWGIGSRRAAQSALLGFMLRFNTYLYKVVMSSTRKKKYEYNTVNFLRVCEKALQLSQLCVHANTESKTTIAGGILAPLIHQFTDENFESGSPPISPHPIPVYDNEDSSSDEEQMSKDLELVYGRDKKRKLNKNIRKSRKKRWTFVGFSVGDSLIYRYSSKYEDVIEITSSDRSGGMRDAGGMLGGSAADLSNLHYYCCLVEEGDFILSLSDGVHDNLDPEVLHVPPVISPNISWSDLNPKEKSTLKKVFKEDKLLQIIEEIEGEKTAANISKAVVNYVLKVTSEYRDNYELAGKLQRDWATMDEKLRDTTNQVIHQKLKNPIGKFDHVTCLTVHVGFGTPCFASS